MSTIYTYVKDNDFSLQMTFFPAVSECDKHCTLLYLHGGALIYGARDDLPILYREMFLTAGYSILTIDYPLAPEAPLPIIVENLISGIDWFNTHAKNTLKLQSSDYVLFGRSAGAYLSFVLAKQLLPISPKGIISFYGYSSLLETSFTNPSSYYNQFPKVTSSSLSHLIKTTRQANASIQDRFPIYLRARQMGSWLSLLLSDRSLLNDYSLNEVELKKLPPVFLTASSADQDVPYSVSQQLSQIIPKVQFHPVLGLPHDFDADTTNPAGKRVYQAAINWLDQLQVVNNRA